jgi:hypothetical protein
LDSLGRPWHPGVFEELADAVAKQLAKINTGKVQRIRVLEFILDGIVVSLKATVAGP